MASTRLTDMIVPEVFTQYTLQRSTELSNLISSGIIQQSPVLGGLINGGGSTFQMPFFQPLTGDSQIIEDGTPLTISKITTEQQTAVVMNRGASWGSTFLAHYMTGADPMRAIGDLVAKWWVEDEQKILTSLLGALFNPATGVIRASHTKDESGTALDNDMLIDAVNLLGDAYTKVSAMIVHSAVYAKMVKLNLIQFVQPSTQTMNVPTYMGLRVIVDDNGVTGGPNFDTYIFGAGAISMGVGSIDGREATETDRDSLSSEDFLIQRRRYCFHPNGFRWTGASMAGTSPTNAEMGNAANWTQVFANKNIPMICLRSAV